MPTETAIARNTHADFFATDDFLELALTSSNGKLKLQPPVFCVDGATVSPTRFVTVTDAYPVFGHVKEQVATFGFGDDLPHLRLEVVVRSVYDSPVLRFCYRLVCDKPVSLTKPDGVETLSYFTLDFSRVNDYGETITAKEMRFAEFNALFHSFMLHETPLATPDFVAERSVVGPFLILKSPNAPNGLVAYEHGSQSNDPFLTYDLHPNGTTATLRAVKGNYWHNQTITPGEPWESLWFQIALTDGDEDKLAHDYRTWVLQHQSPNIASRKPYLFYNTWNYQERVKASQKRPYLADMNEARMLSEIDRKSVV